MGSEPTEKEDPLSLLRINLPNQPSSSCLLLNQPKSLSFLSIFPPTHIQLWQATAAILASILIDGSLFCLLCHNETDRQTDGHRHRHHTHHRHIDVDTHATVAPLDQVKTAFEINPKCKS
jgi:hypothetical protein